MNKLVMMLRIKDGLLFIERWLNSVERYADEIVVVDNGSTDGTYEIMQKHPKVVEIQRTYGFDEGRDRILLLEMARKRQPDWMMTLDADEIFEEAVRRETFDKYMSQPFFHTIGFRLFPMKIDEEHYSATADDIFFVSQPRRYLFKNSESLFVPNVKIHCGVHGLSKRMMFSTLRLKHLCDLHIDYRSKVYDAYMNLDSRHSFMYQKHKSNLAEAGSLLAFKERRGAPLYIFAEYMGFNAVYLFHYPFKKISKLKRRLKRKITTAAVESGKQGGDSGSPGNQP